MCLAPIRVRGRTPFPELVLRPREAHDQRYIRVTLEEVNHLRAIPSRELPFSLDVNSPN